MKKYIGLLVTAAVMLSMLVMALPASAESMHMLDNNGWREDFDNEFYPLGKEPLKKQFSGSTVDDLIHTSATAYPNNISVAADPADSGRGNNLKFTATRITSQKYSAAGCNPAFTNKADNPKVSFTNNKDYVLISMDWFFPKVIQYTQNDNYVKLQQIVAFKWTGSTTNSDYFTIDYTNEGIKVFGKPFPVPTGRWVNFKIGLYYNEAQGKVLADVYIDNELKLADFDFTTSVVLRNGRTWPQTFLDNGLQGTSISLLTNTVANGAEWDQYKAVNVDNPGSDEVVPYEAYLDNLEIYSPDDYIVTAPRITKGGSLTGFPEGTVDLWIRVGNGLENAAPSTMVVALYDDGMLKHVWMQQAQTDAKSIGDLKATIDFPDTSSYTKAELRVFVWDDANNIRPLAKEYIRVK